MDDSNTESITAPQSRSVDVAGGGEDGIKTQTSERSQCSSVEMKSNPSSLQPEKAWFPITSVPMCPAQSANIDPSGTITLKMQRAVLPMCLGESTVLLPVHFQMHTGTPAQVSPTGATPLLLSSHGPGSLPLMLEQQLFQHFNSQCLPQGPLCSAAPLQSSALCQNPSVTFCQPSAMEQKVAEPASFVPTPGFAAVSQDQFTSHNSFTQFSCHMAGPNPAQAFPPSFLPTPPSVPLPFPYSSPLAPLVPPATLLVPFPIIVPLPVPVPIPIPIPIPIEPKAKVQKPASTAAVGTQTCDGLFSPVCPSHTADSEGSVLDLSMMPGPSQMKQEVLIPQDSPLDLSVANHVHKPLFQVKHPDVKQPMKDVQRSLEVFKPLERGQNLDSKLLNGLTSLEFSRHRKWLVDGHRSHESKYSARNYDVVSTSQTAKVIVAVKDSVPTIFCGKRKDLAGMSSNTFPSKQDTQQGALVRQHCNPVLKAQSETGHLTDPRRSIPRNRTVKLKKVSSQEIHILPIKKQRFAPFFHGE